METIRVGLVGFGMIGKLHTMAYRNLPFSVKNPKISPSLAALLRSHVSDTAGQADSGFAFVTTVPDEFYSQKLDAVDICTPNHLHYAQALQALETGTPVYCEKPLALDWEESNRLATLAEQRGLITQVAYMMRYAPGIRQMKKIIHDGEIGDILHFRAYKYHASYLDAHRPVTWRLRFDQSGGGAFQDLGSHLVDLVRYLLGDAARVRAEMRTFISQRPESAGSSRLKSVDVDDWMHCMLDLPDGALGEIEVSRVAAGAGEATGVEIYGSKGSVIYNSAAPETASFYDLNRKYRQASDVTPGPVAGERPIEMLWPEKKFSQGDMLNRAIAAQYDFLLNVAEKTPAMSDFRSAARTQEIIEAAYRSARQGGNWQDIPPLK